VAAGIHPRSSGQHGPPADFAAGASSAETERRNAYLSLQHPIIQGGMHYDGFAGMLAVA
jgi:hypothetical protein